jgi:flagellar biosynthesis protein FlhB
VSDAGEKTFEATPHRIAIARREGNVARSGELAANCSFAGGAVAAIAIAPLLGSAAAHALVRSTFFLPTATPSLTILSLALIPVGFAALAGVLTNLVQNGGLVFIAITPKVERLNPIEGMRRIISRETIGHSLRATFAFFCATFATLPTLIACGSALMRSANLLETVNQVWSAAERAVLAAGIVGLVFSVAEYGAARAAWLRRLRMSFEERKRELKEEEGDAFARGRRRSLHRSLLRGGINRVKEAAFVVVNPTHLAVALAYRPPGIPVPEVLVRARDDAAARVREVAAIYRIPVVENASLARALYRDARAGDTIPHAHYVVVAEVVAALIRTKEIAR